MSRGALRRPEAFEEKVEDFVDDRLRLRIGVLQQQLEALQQLLLLVVLQHNNKLH